MLIPAQQLYVGTAMMSVVQESRLAPLGWADRRWDSRRNSEGGRTLHRRWKHQLPASFMPLREATPTQLLSPMAGDWLKEFVSLSLTSKDDFCLLHPTLTFLVN